MMKSKGASLTNCHLLEIQIDNLSLGTNSGDEILGIIIIILN
jgi:hypothetical protein